jgi:hypothetical protein
MVVLEHKSLFRQLQRLGGVSMVGRDESEEKQGLGGRLSLLQCSEAQAMSRAMVALGDQGRSMPKGAGLRGCVSHPFH